MWVLAGIAFPVKGIVLWWHGTHRASWRKVGVKDLRMLIQAVFIATAVSAVAVLILQRKGLEVVPRSVPLIEAMFAVIVLGGMRLGMRTSAEMVRGRRYSQPIHKTLIVGAGEAGTMIVREMLRHPEAGHRPVGFVDDDPAKRRQRIAGLKVLGDLESLPDIAEKHDVDEVVIAMPSASGSTVRKIVQSLQSQDVKYRIIPGIFELLSGQVSISALREVDVNDLLRRAPVKLDERGIAGYVQDRTILVTGAGGSIGSEITRQVTRFAPARIILLGRGENSIYEINRELRPSSPQIELVPIICDVRDDDRLRRVFAEYRPDVIFHAAAHKHVPLMECNPEESIKNNVIGTSNVARAALDYGVSRLVNISTDKAVNPTSVMGASKRVGELVVARMAQDAKSEQSFVSVRFGNVLGSRGSVVPLFREQIESGGPITVTDPEMVRFFMTIPEATQLVIQAGALGVNGNVYVLDMGEPVRILDLANDMIRLSGLAPGRDIEVVYTGIRPGEKLYEELLTDEEGTDVSQHRQIFVARKQSPDADWLDGELNNLIAAAEKGDRSEIQSVLRSLVPTFQVGVAEPS